MKRQEAFKKCGYCGQFLPKAVWQYGVHDYCDMEAGASDLESIREAMDGCALTEDECDALGLPYPNTSPF